MKCAYCFDNKILFIPEGYETTDIEYCPVCNKQDEDTFNQVVYDIDMNEDSLVHDIESDLYKFQLPESFFLDKSKMIREYAKENGIPIIELDKKDE